MPTIHALAGISGAGKTYARTNNPLLLNLPYIDVADYYAQFPGIGPSEAWTRLEVDLINAMDKGGDIVVEAWFKHGGFQRGNISILAQANGYEVVWWEFVLDRETCKSRIEQDFQNHLAEHPEQVEQLLDRRNARLHLLDVAAW